MTAVENEGSRLLAALQAAGFTVAGAGWGYVRVGWPGSDPGRENLMLPTDATAPEYAEMLAAAVETLRAEARRGEAARHALNLAGEVTP